MNKIILVTAIVSIIVIGSMNIVYGQSKAEVQSYVNGEFDIIMKYCIEHAGDKQNPILDLFGVKPPNPVQDLVKKGLVADHFSDDTCQSVKGGYDFMRLMPMEKWIEALYDGGQAQNTTVQRLTSGKDCPATQHLYSGICEDNADGKADPSADNPNRSSRLDCASNEFSCKSEGLIK
jgi:hypothetical protein